MGHCCGTKSEKFLISLESFCLCVCGFWNLLTAITQLSLILQPLSYLTNSIFLCLLNNQSDSEQPDISHPLAQCKPHFDLHIKSYSPGWCDRDEEGGSTLHD
ncbi:hypothetical protein ATANTOWER_001046 [Ataeniobius toweri]|uniref:Uncharacterized protein n=1 Tax=Ataeniobius toweri TaxID=208326 RepID=A0ABU7ASN8_9TELE|nr:hypothetical protein [Ataeniobius toweri]